MVVVGVKVSRDVGKSFEKKLPVDQHTRFSYFYD